MLFILNKLLEILGTLPSLNLIINKCHVIIVKHRSEQIWSLNTKYL